MDEWRHEINQEGRPEENPRGAPDFKLIFESIPTPYLLLDTNLIILDANDVYLDLIKAHRQDVVGKPLFEIFPYDPCMTVGIQKLRESLQKVIETRMPDVMDIQQYSIPNPENCRGPLLDRYWQLSNYPVIDAEGGFVSIIHYLEDVTDFIEAKNKVHYTEDSNIQLKDIRVFLESVLGNLPMMVFIKETKDLKYIKINKAGEELIGFSEEEIFGKTDYELFPKEQADSFVAGDRKVLAEGLVMDIPREAMHTHVIGDRILHTRKVPIYDQNHKPLYLVGISEDITGKIDLIEAQLAKSAAEEMANRKSRFVDIAAHELRTPVTSLKLFLQLAIRQTQKGKPLTLDILTRVREPAERLSRLVIDLLDMSRLERGLLALIPVPTDLTLLITRCIEDFQLQYPNRAFLFHRPPYTVNMNLDPLRINQIITNLMDNAVKYAIEGPVEIILEDYDDYVKVSVKDYGPGITAAQKDTIFSPINRGSSDTVLRTSGLGLGLSVCFGIIKLHGGNIGVESVPGEGATFYFDLPKHFKESKKDETSVSQS